MASKQLRLAPRIVRKPNVPEEVRTPAQDQVADWIGEHAADEWSKWSYTDVADEMDVSRQHVSNTVENYFKPADVGDAKSNGRQITAGQPDAGVLGELDAGQVPDWIVEKVKEAYRDGYRDGFADGRDLS